MRGFSGRLPWSWTTNVVYEMNYPVWRATVKIPEDIAIPKSRYWAIYNPHFHEFILTGREKIDLYHIDAVQTAKSAEEELILGYRKGWLKALQ